jgi:phage terminase Nu1 subunit (DNA packaging protein)
MKAPPLTQDQAAALRGVTTRRMRQLDGEENAPPRDDEGRYPAAEFGAWLRDHWMAEAGVANDGKSYDYNAERARLTKAQADKTELEVREIRGEVVRMPVVELHWTAMVSSMRAKLLALPSKLAAAIAPPEKLQLTMDTSQALVHEALAEIAGDAIPHDIRTRVAAQQRATDEGDCSSSAEALAESVGG